jgi:hypothetical protein
LSGSEDPLKVGLALAAIPRAVASGSHRFAVVPVQPVEHPSFVETMSLPRGQDFNVGFFGYSFYHLDNNYSDVSIIIPSLYQVVNKMVDRVAILE